MLAIRARARSMGETLALGRAALRIAEQRRSAVLGASIVSGPAVVLGARQRAGRVVQLEACALRGAAVVRRATSGTAAWIGDEGVVFTLALPHVAAIVPDATPRTLLNRNVRPFLKGFSRAGVIAHYFGREWISLRQKPAALLGFEVTRTGAVLIEVFVGVDQSFALPLDLTTEDERAIDRWPGKTPAALREVLPDVPAEAFAMRVLDGFIERAGQAAEELDVSPAELEPLVLQSIGDERDPVPEGQTLRPLVKVPIGWLEAAVSPDEPAHEWLGGDVLAPSWLFEEIAAGKGSAELGAAAIEGATIADLVQAVRG